MSLGYAEKLSYREDVGTVGMSEIFDPPHALQEKIEKLAVMIQESKHLVAFTGAGISTSCGIPDFRGPKGIWTLQNPEILNYCEMLLKHIQLGMLEHEGKGLPEASLPFHRAVPSLTHMALVELEKAGILKFVVSQNVDSLHLRSGIPREKLSELHGNSFMEICPACGIEYLRDFEVETIGLKETSRRCSNIKCGAKLKDTVLDWEDALPTKEMKQAEQHCKMADVVLCLGTSLQITPACNMPLKALRGGGEVVIVNLQPTPKDKKASLVINGLVDEVIAGALNLLNLQIPPYIRVDHLQISLAQFSRISETRYVKWALKISSVHGQKAPVPFINTVEVSFSDRPDLKSAILHKQPFQLKRVMVKTRPFTMLLKLNFSDGCGCPCSEIEFPVDFENSRDGIKLDKHAGIQKLKDMAVQDSNCGQHAVLERTIPSAAKSEVTVYAIITNIVRYSNPLATPKGFEAFPERNGTMVKRRNKNMKHNKNSPKRSRCS